MIDYHSELQALVDACESFAEPVIGHRIPWQTALDRARTALAEPEPEGPTDEEIGEWADACSEAPLEELDPEVHGWRRCFTAQEFSETIRAALARWGSNTSRSN